MKASELRIGNYYFALGTIDGFGSATVQCATSYDIQVIEEHPDWGNPIPLDELWLEKMGFKSVGLHGQVFELYIDDETRFVIETDCKTFYPKINFDDCCFYELKYVHRLQNLYFALTEEELTIK